MLFSVVIFILKLGVVGVNAFLFVRRGRRLDDPLFLPLMREVAFAAGKRRRERNGKISLPVKCCAFDSPLSEGAETAGAKFSEFGHLTAGASPRPTL